MKITFVTYLYWPPHFGGELKISIERFESLVKRGHSVTVLTSGVPGYPDNEVINGVHIKRSPIIHNSRFGRGIRRLLFPIWSSCQIRRMKLDILHYGGMGGIEPITNRLSMQWLNHLAHVKGARVVWVHSLADSEEVAFGEVNFSEKMRNKALEGVDAIVSVSPALQDGVKNYFPEKARLILNGVRDDVFFPLAVEMRQAFRKHQGIEDDQVVFSFLGTLTRRKGFDLLSVAFFDLLNDLPMIRLWAVGPNNHLENQNYTENSIDLIGTTTQHIPNAVKYWGRIDDREELAMILASSDVFVFPSRREGFGLAPVEAMACGVPAIISRIPGVTDLVSVEGETGRYVEVNDAKSLQAAMKELAVNPELRTIMGKAASQRVQKYFGWENHIGKWEALYQSLL